MLYQSGDAPSVDASGKDHPLLLGMVDSDGHSPLALACREGRTEVVRLLLWAITQRARPIIPDCGGGGGSDNVDTVRLHLSQIMHY